MNLLFIYGPPASGKLTVATELSKLSGYPLFHNHLTRDLVQSVYPDSLYEHYGLVDKLREDILAYCAQHGTNIIFTFVYDGPEDDKIVAGLVDSVTKNKGDVRFVELVAPGDVLLDRVSNDSRKAHKKLVDRAILSDLLEKTPYSSVPYADILRIDTAKSSPQEAATKIAEHYKLL